MMIDVNLGNKTLTVGVVIALILAYGMVNFNGGSSQPEGVFPTVDAASHAISRGMTPQALPTEQATLSGSLGEPAPDQDSPLSDMTALSTVQKNFASATGSKDDGRDSRRRMLNR